jgi:hypothetical protein
MATVCPGTRLSGPPKKYTKVLQEGTEWIEIEMVDREGEAIAYENYRVKTPAGETLEGRGLLAGIVTFKGLAKGTCQFVLSEHRRESDVSRQNPRGHDRSWPSRKAI